MTLFLLMIFSSSFGDTKMFLECPASLEVHVYSMFSAYLLQAFTHTLYIWDYNVALGVNCASGGLLLFFILIFLEDLLYCPPRIFACSQYFFQMLEFLFDQVCGRADGMCPMCQSVDDTVLGSHIMCTVPWEVQVSVGRFSVYPHFKAPIFFWCDDCVQKWYGAIFLCLFHSELDGIIYCVDMLKELLFVLLLLYDPGIINISSPYSRGCSAVAKAFLSKASIKMLAIMGLMGDPMAAPLVCS